MHRRDVVRPVALVAAVMALAGCGGGANQTATPQAPSGPADGGLEHIHGLGVSGETLFIATHTGLWTAPRGDVQARRFGSSRQDIMGFSVLREGRFVGSGHPDPSQTDQPPNLGLIESRDGGRSWRSVSLRGDADFHVLQSAGNSVYGVNSADGQIMASSDAGRSWQRHKPPAGVFSLAIDPRAGKRILVSTERGVFASQNGGEQWRPLRTRLAGLLAWPAGGRLYLLGGDGEVQMSADGGQTWKPTGAIGGEPTAFIAHGADLYASLSDNTVKRSADGGRTWTLRAAP